MAMVTMTAMANGNSDGNCDCNGDGGWQRQWLWRMAMVLAMANSNCNGNDDGDGDGNGNGQWLTAMATAMVAAMEKATTIAMATGTMVARMTVMTTDTRGGCLFMFWQCAALWQGQRLVSPPWAQRSVHCPVLHHLGATAKSVCSISRGMDPESSPWIVFLFFSTTCSVY